MEYYVNKTNNFNIDKLEGKIYMPNVFFANGSEDIGKESHISDIEQIKLIDYFFNSFDQQTLVKIYEKSDKTDLQNHGLIDNAEFNNLIGRLNHLEEKNKNLNIKYKKLMDELFFNISRIEKENEAIKKINVLDLSKHDSVFKALKKIKKFNIDKVSFIENIESQIKTIFSHSVQNGSKQIDRKIEDTIELVSKLMISENNCKLFEKYIGEKIINKEKIIISEEPGDLPNKVLRIDNYFEFNDKYFIVDFKLKHNTTDDDLYKQIVYSAFLKEKSQSETDKVIGVMIKPKNCEEINVDKGYMFLNLKIYVINIPSSRILNANYHDMQQQIVNKIEEYDIKKLKRFRMIVEK